MTQLPDHHRETLAEIAERALVERGFLAALPEAAAHELEGLDEPARVWSAETPDLRDLPWCSIDNDDSRDLDQITCAEALEEGAVRVMVGIADVDALVQDESALDLAARHNTTSVYTAARVFPMLPEKLSCGLTSLNPGEDRVAMVASMTFDRDGVLQEWDVLQARVRNHAQLAYDAVGAWLLERGPMPEAMQAVPGLPETLHLQDRIARRLEQQRREAGALDLETIAPVAVFHEDVVVDLRLRGRNRATRIIENLMIAANGVAARYLDECSSPSLRRVVRSPERWTRITEVAEEHGATLPPEPDATALRDFLAIARSRDPEGFPDLSLIIVKLLGRGEYVAVGALEDPPGHFGLAVEDYAHSTAPNRRYPDVLTQRLLKAALRGRKPPYERRELDDLGFRCTEMEHQAEKVERSVRKSAAALFLSGRIGERFEAIVTGSNSKGTWIRLLTLPVEGKLIKGGNGLRVGARVVARLVETDAWAGHIDFVRA